MDKRIRDLQRRIIEYFTKNKNKFDRICRTYFFVFVMMSEKRDFCHGRKTENQRNRSERMKYCHVKNQCLVIRLPGEIDHCQAEDIRQECEMMFLKACVRDVIFDFTGTNFMDSSGIGLILGRLRQVQPMEGRVFLFGGSPSMEKMWKMSGILGKVTVLNTIEEMKEVYE